MGLIIKGILIGIGKILPGVSGAMIAISIGEYDRIIENIANIKEEPIKKLGYLSKLGTGIMIAIILISKVIVKCLNKYYFMTMLLFLIVILHSMKGLIKNIKLKKKDIKNIIVIIIIITIFSIIISNIKLSEKITIKYNAVQFVELIGTGMIDAASSIIPGLSGTALLMMMGYYNIIIETFSNMLKLSQIKNNIFIMAPFIIGFVLGVFVISKMLDKVRKKYPDILNVIILSLMICSIFEIIKKII